MARHIESEIFQTNTRIISTASKISALKEVIEDLKYKVQSLEQDMIASQNELYKLINEQNENKDCK